MRNTAFILDAKLNYLFSRTGGHTIKLGLETTRALLAAVGVDPLLLPCIHVAGTNGKGSVSAMLESALREAGLRTALYTSPHLIRFSERIRVLGQPIPDEDLLRLLDEVENADQRLAAETENRNGTFFELTTVMAMKWFSEQKAQIIVLETGLGGRLDSTNVVTPLLSVLTEIGLDHKVHLGETIEKIAAEKAGIIKPGRPVVLGLQRTAALSVIEEIARIAQAPILRARERVSVRRISQNMDGQNLAIETSDGPWKPFRLPLLGDFQLGNCALAITALEWMRDELHWPLTPDTIRGGLEKTKWPARCQIISKEPTILLDVAHNPDGAQALALFIKKFRNKRPVALLCGMLADKDAAHFFRTLRPVVDACVLVPLDSERNMPPEQLLAAAQAAGLPAAEDILPRALHNAKIWAAKNNGILVIAGSFHLASAILNELQIEV